MLERLMSSIKKEAYRIINPAGHSQILRRGFQRHFFSDNYHFLLTSHWLILFLIISFTFIALNGIFALAYLAGGNVIEGAKPGSFSDAFFFSVQTMATLGYGKMHPVGLYANIISTIEVFLGLLGLALATGLLFAKFSKPTARVLFSRVAVISIRNGVPSLMFRMANGRKNQIIHAKLSLSLICNETTQEGQSFRRFYDVKLLRDYTPVFGLTWLAIHPIDSSSPLFNRTRETLQELEVEIIVNFSGVDDTFLQTVHEQHSYLPEEIEWNATFEDILLKMPDGRRCIDYRLFHKTKPIALPS